MSNEKIYKAYYFSEAWKAVEIYYGESLDRAKKAADRWEEKGYAVEIWCESGTTEERIR